MSSRDEGIAGDLVFAGTVKVVGGVESASNAGRWRPTGDPADPEQQESPPEQDEPETGTERPPSRCPIRRRTAALRRDCGSCGTAAEPRVGGDQRSALLARSRNIPRQAQASSGANSPTSKGKSARQRRQFRSPACWSPVCVPALPQPHDAVSPVTRAPPDACSARTPRLDPTLGFRRGSGSGRPAGRSPVRCGIGA